MKQLGFWLVGLALISGCAVGPDYKRPDLSVPTAYRGSDGKDVAASLADLPWWEVFQDNKLEALLNDSLKNNYDLRIAVARVEEAQALAGVSRAGYYPQVGLSSNAAYGRSQGATALPWNVTGSLSWELDIWGRVRRTAEAGWADFMASEENRRAVVASLVATVAQAYFELCEADAELQVIHSSVLARRETLQLFQMRLEGGVASKLETSRAEAALAETLAQKWDVERRIAQKENQISILLGRNPGPIERNANLYMRGSMPTIPVGIPSTLLERRPDVRQAEQNLRSANAKVGIAKANFFPVISLTGSLGGQSDVLASSLGSGSLLATIGAGLVAPLFQGGRIYRNWQAAKARWEQSKLTYQQTVLTSFREVADNLVAHEKLRFMRAEEERAVAAQGMGVTLSKLRYQGGLSNYLEVLDAEQDYFQQQINLEQTHLNQLIAFVQLYKALGGGWGIAPAQPGTTQASTSPHEKQAK